MTVCEHCGERFTTGAGYEKHRSGGRFGGPPIPAGRCLKPSLYGMFRNERGEWTERVS